MSKIIAIGGSAADPVSLAHPAVVKAVCDTELFEKVIWIPSGTRRDKDVAPTHHRQAMIELAMDAEWQGSQKVPVCIDRTEIETASVPTFHRLTMYEKKYLYDHEIVWYTGVDSIVPREEYRGKCEIEARWVLGRVVMRGWRFYILPRKGYPHPEEVRNNLPKYFRYKTIEADIPEIASSDIRQRIRKKSQWEHLVHPDVAEYIREHKLYGFNGGGT